MVFILMISLVLAGWLFSALVFIIAMLGLSEFYNLVTSEFISPQRIYGIFSGALLYVVIVIFDFIDLPDQLMVLGSLPLLLPVGIFFFSFVAEIFRKKSQPLVNIAITILGIFYIVFPLALLSLMNRPFGIYFWNLPVLLGGYLILTWLYDTGAYLFGKQFGKHKFFERISPKKTWEGIIAGIVVAVVTSVGMFYLVQVVRLTDWLVICLLVVIFGTLGDLVESLIKRSLNLKDSGSILPGHGGILDRFDSIFLSAPFVFLYLFLRNLI